MANEPEIDEEFLPKPPTPLLVKITFVLVVINLGGTVYTAMRKLEPVVIQAEAPAAAASEMPGPMVEMDPFVVNLNEPNGPRYLKTKFEVELKDEESQPFFDRSKPAIRDGVLRHLSGLSVADTIGAESKAQIRDAVLALVKKEVGDETKVRSVYFSEFVVQ